MFDFSQYSLQNDDVLESVDVFQAVDLFQRDVGVDDNIVWKVASVCLGLRVRREERHSPSSLQVEFGTVQLFALVVAAVFGSARDVVSQVVLADNFQDFPSAGLLQEGPCRQHFVASSATAAAVSSTPETHVSHVSGIEIAMF